MNILIFGTDNGYGLSKDRAVLAGQLTEHAVTFAAPAKGARGTFDVAFHLEHVLSKNFRNAPINIAIPNPEWCSRPMWTALGDCTAIWAKTRHAERIFGALGRCPVIYTGWTSPDPYDATVPRVRSIAHIAGLSPLKSTHAVVDAMAHLPNITGRVFYRRGTLGATPNFEHIKQPQTEVAMRHAINSSAIHLLPSQAEGFGHMINEALACGATVITTDAEPMNTFGAQYHVRTTGSHPQNLVDVHHLDPTDLRRKIQEAWETYSGIDTDAREAYLLRDRLFRSRFAGALKTLVA